MENERIEIVALAKIYSDFVDNEHPVCQDILKWAG